MGRGNQGPRFVARRRTFYSGTLWVRSAGAGQMGLAVLVVLGAVVLSAASEPAKRATRYEGGESSAACSKHMEQWPQFSGVYPHLAAVSQSYTEAGIGAVVPWAGRLWYLSYVAHIQGKGVGLYEIGTDLSIARRPESVVGTHAGRMIHRESNQLVIGPYVIDAEGNVRVIEALTRERITAVARHLTDPQHKVYVQAMEGKLYEVDLLSLETTLLCNAARELGIGQGLPADRPYGAATHFKGAYTAQGRLVVANNTYDGFDQQHGYGGGRLAEWDGHRWKTIRQTAYCEVTTAAGVKATPGDSAALFAVGWDRGSVILSVLHRGKWHHYRLPKGSQSHDHAWCTEWPRIRRVDPGRLMLDMHGLFYLLDPAFAPGNTGSLRPLAGHLRITPDFCRWGDRLVLAGDETSSIHHRHRTGGQPQSNLWFGTLDQIDRWGEPAGWGAVWYEQTVEPGQPSDPFLIAGFHNRTLFVFHGKLQDRVARCSDRFQVIDIPQRLARLPRITVRRGTMERPGAGYRFVVNQAVIVYLAVHDRGKPSLPAGWEPAGMHITWRHRGTYTDTVYSRRFPAGTVEIPEHNGRNELGHFGVPHMCFVQPAEARAGELEITSLPGQLDARVQLPDNPAETCPVDVALEIDRDGSGRWSPYDTIAVPVDGVWKTLPNDLPGVWMRLVPRDRCRLVAQFCFGPHYEPRRRTAERFAALSPAEVSQARVHGALLPFAERLWFVGNIGRAEGKLAAGALYEVGAGMRLVRRGESLPGVYLNRKMVADRLSIGPHLIDEHGRVRTITGLARQAVAATIRHPRQDRTYVLTIDGKLFEVELTNFSERMVADIPAELGLPRKQLRFKAGHLAGNTVLVAAVAADGQSGCLAEYDGRQWKLLRRDAFAEVCNLGSMSETVLAVGWDRASCLLLIRRPSGTWETCRLPKASSLYEKAWSHYWPRMREVETERILLDAHGLFYEVSGLTYAWSIRPVCAHRRMISDFCSWRGLLVLAGCDLDARADANFVAGADSLCLWFGKTDDLWQLPPPAGHGGPWLSSPTEAGKPSDPYLMWGFESKRVELRHDAPGAVRFTIEVDPTVQRRYWLPLTTVEVPGGQSVVYRFPKGFSAHWVRLKTDRDCRATAMFTYTGADAVER